MKARILLRILLIILLILLATPLLGALAIMASGNSMAQLPAITGGRMVTLAITWIALILVLIITAIVSIVRSMGRRNLGEGDKAA